MSKILKGFVAGGIVLSLINSGTLQVTADEGFTAISTSTSLENIYNEFSRRMRQATPGLLNEFRQRSLSNTSGTDGLGNISDELVRRLSDIYAQGVAELAEMAGVRFQYNWGTLDYSYLNNYWAGRLDAVFMGEASRITALFWELVANPIQIRSGHITSGVNFRTGAGNTHSIIRSLSEGVSFTFLREQNGWWNIRIGNQEGWVHGNHATLGISTGHITSGVNFRTGAGNTHSIIRSLSQGAYFTFLREQNGWWNIRVGNQEGWVHGNHATLGTSTGHTLGGVNFRTGAGNTHSTIRSLPQGTSFNYIREQNGWWQVRIGNQTGWIHGNNATFGTTAGHVTSGVNFRTGAGNTTSIIRSLSEGTSFTFLREQNGWWNIRVGNQTGWIHGNHGGFGTSNGVISSGVNFRTGPGNTHNVISSLTRGTSFTFLREQNGWWNVRIGNQEGWVHGNHATLGMLPMLEKVLVELPTKEAYTLEYLYSTENDYQEYRKDYQSVYYEDEDETYAVIDYEVEYYDYLYFE